MLKRASPITLAPCSVICEHSLARQGQAGSTRLEPEATQCQSGPLKGPRRSNRELSAEYRMPQSHPLPALEFVECPEKTIRNN
jgi:hypothetical protein